MGGMLGESSGVARSVRVSRASTWISSPAERESGVMCPSQLSAVIETDRDRNRP